MSEDIVELVKECCNTWKRAEELLEKLEEIAIKKCLDEHSAVDPYLSTWYDDAFEPLWSLEDRGYVEFRWMGRKIYLEARIYRDGRVECIAKDRHPINTGSSPTV